ncbi:outer membrane beta-barrel protein [Ferrimonas balearica]|uniref:outer membrane beta-barrel protein n=1 Tax=Ferrimonas balearica TaxID=44012 RepID=UPI001C5765CE|nr:outer membrane beta-barrel protein [Ferrimonas balearica]MBW3138203.1 outer membrane beta-barrel protein [Ferrimonas balearica]MBW3164242.1 outer membrane beta-barrel protein [Ferrimonas balearica]MBY6105268.1 outer membrane beta-barrel protein [Ferrimonas balearica]MBY6225118.1 outer membrane beta-barrel protein [Ferrimonas balearica]
MAVVSRNITGLLLALAAAAPAHAEQAWNWNLGVGGSVFYQSNSGGEQSPEYTDTSFRPNLQVGIERAINERWTMGTGLELLVEDAIDWGNSGNLLMWRIAEFGYQVSDNWSLSFYGGAGRYYRETSAYGYGLGAGAQYQLNANWALSFELSYVGTDTSINDAVPFKRDKFGWGSTVLRYRF